MTNTLTSDFAESIMDNLIKLTTHNKPLIRKKTYALIAKCFSLNFNLIPTYIEKVIDKIKVGEAEPSKYYTKIIF